MRVTCTARRLCWSRSICTCAYWAQPETDVTTSKTPSTIEVRMAHPWSKGHWSFVGHWDLVIGHSPDLPHQLLLHRRQLGHRLHVLSHQVHQLIQRDAIADDSRVRFIDLLL